MKIKRRKNQIQRKIYIYKKICKKLLDYFIFQEERRRLQAEAAEKRLKDQEVIKEKI